MQQHPESVIVNLIFGCLNPPKAIPDSTPTLSATVKGRRGVYQIYALIWRGNILKIHAIHMYQMSPISTTRGYFSHVIIKEFLFLRMASQGFMVAALGR